MPAYTFTGAFPRVLTGLIVGVNARITKADKTVPPEGSTVTAVAGDLVTTDEPYEHPELVPTPTQKPAAPAEPQEN